MNELILFFKTIDKVYVYLILFFSCYIENIFPPFPGDTVVVIGVYLAVIGLLEFSYTYIVVCIGSILGFMTFYFIGVMFKEKVIKKKERESKFFKKIERIEIWFRRYGYKVILANRFLAGARTMVALTAGIAGMNGRKVFLVALLSVVVWNGVLAYCGYLLGENWGVLLEYIKKYNYGVFAIIIALIIVYFAYKYKKRGRWFA